MFLSRGGLHVKMLDESWERATAEEKNRDPEKEDLKVKKVHRNTALRSMHPHVSMWRQYPNTETKQPMVDAYHSLSDEQRHQLHLDVRKAMLDYHGDETIEVYRHPKSGDRGRKDWGASSFSTNPDHLRPAIGGLKARVHWKDVMAHHGQKDMPLGSGTYRGEQEIILKPDANVEVEHVPPRD